MSWRRSSRGSSHHDYLPAIEQLLVLVALQTVTGLVGTYTNMQQQLVTELEAHSVKTIGSTSNAFARICTSSRPTAAR